ncbi:hypothetical protein GOV13_02635 [Candidatus Pacearchaeota archaeon]|nr:hypothetical protein [Candidatus Pacearchaeota archaeon]
MKRFIGDMKEFCKCKKSNHEGQKWDYKIYDPSKWVCRTCGLKIFATIGFAPLGKVSPAGKVKTASNSEESDKT